MKRLTKLRLNEVSKTNLLDSEMKLILGGNYCAFGYENQVANINEGKCSCICSEYSGSYSSSLQSDAQYMKQTGPIP